LGKIGIGVDIGGSHIYSAAVDLSQLKIIPGSGSNIKIDNKACAEEILDGWSRAINKTILSINRTDLAGIGFAMPGPFDYTKGIALFERVEKYESLYGVNVSDEIRERLLLDVDIPFRYINDATAFAIAEAWIGKGTGTVNVIALTLGTGFGSAFIRDGVPVLNGPSVPEMGCVWHLPYKDSIANDYFSTHWFLDRYLEKTGNMVEGVKELADLAVNDSVASDLFMEYGRIMGDFLAPWISKFNAGIIVIGGNITGAYYLFGKFLESSLEKNNHGTSIQISEMKEDAAIFGAARLLDEPYWNNVQNLLSLM